MLDMDIRSIIHRDLLNISIFSRQINKIISSQTYEIKGKLALIKCNEEVKLAIPKSEQHILDLVLNKKAFYVGGLGRNIFLYDDVSKIPTTIESIEQPKVRWISGIAIPIGFYSLILSFVLKFEIFSFIPNTIWLSIVIVSTALVIAGFIFKRVLRKKYLRVLK